MLTRLDHVPSTMELAHAAAEAGAGHGTAFMALRQDAGRGSRGRPWVSELGGLWLSVVTRPDRADAVSALSLRVGIAVAGALEVAIPGLPDVQVKWPNDLLVEQRKLAGVLCEAAWSGARCRWVVIGIGVNVCNALPGGLDRPAARCDSWAPGLSPDDLVDCVSHAIALAGRSAGPLTDSELAAFGKRDALVGLRVREPVPGMAAGIRSDGALLVQDPSGRPHPILSGLVLDPV